MEIVKLWGKMETGREWTQQWRSPGLRLDRTVRCELCMGRLCFRWSLTWSSGINNFLLLVISGILYRDPNRSKVPAHPFGGTGLPFLCMRTASTVTCLKLSARSAGLKAKCKEEYDTPLAMHQGKKVPLIGDRPTQGNPTQILKPARENTREGKSKIKERCGWDRGKGSIAREGWAGLGWSGLRG